MSDLCDAWGIEAARPLAKSDEWREVRLFLVEPEQGDLFELHDDDTMT